MTPYRVKFLAFFKDFLLCFIPAYFYKLDVLSELVVAGKGVQQVQGKGNGLEAGGGCQQAYQSHWQVFPGHVLFGKRVNVAIVDHGITVGC